MTKYAIFIGIDISKQWFDAALYWSGLKGNYPIRRFDNRSKGFEALIQWLEQQRDQHKIQGACYVCMEHTGIYGLALAHFLEQNHIKVVMECPLRIERSLGLRRGKTDLIDAICITNYAYEKHPKIKVRPLPSPLLLQLQALLSLRYRLKRYEHGLKVAANELHNCVQHNISGPVVQYTSHINSTINEQLKVIDQRIKQLIDSDSKLKQLYRLLISVVGIGPLIAAYLIVYTNGFTAFQKSRQFCSYIGIAPFPHSSGSSVKLPDKVSYLANKRIKALISTAATVAVIHDPELRNFFKKKKAEGKDNGWIYNVVKNKIVHRVFAVVKRGTPFVKRELHLS